MNILLSLLLMFQTIVRTETAHFNIFQNGRKIGAEDFSITPKAGGYVAQGRTQISVGNQDLRSRMELDAQLNPTLYEYESKGNRIRLKVDKPLSELEYTIDGKSQSHDVRFPEGAAILDDNFFHHYLLLLYRAGISGAAVPTFVPQQMTLGTVVVRSVGNQTYELQTSDVKLVATTDLEGRLIRISVPDAKVVVER